jgi:hypothetical protein
LYHSSGAIWLFYISIDRIVPAYSIFFAKVGFWYDGQTDRELDSKWWIKLT